MTENELPVHWDLTQRIIGAFRTVYNRLQAKLPEDVYVRALEIECRKLGLQTRREAPIAVYYDGRLVGRFRADLLINGVVVVEVKTGDRCAAHYAQLLNYLRCSRMRVGLLLHFAAKPHSQRITLPPKGDRPKAPPASS